MSFTITITESKKTLKIVKGPWGVVGTKEVPREERFYASRQDEPETRLEEIRDYLPSREEEVSEDVQVLKQTVESLDICAVIKAINNL